MGQIKAEFKVESAGQYSMCELQSLGFPSSSNEVSFV